MSNRALITVVIPVKNEDHDTLVKVLYDLQQYSYETIVVDDGSDIPVVGADLRFEPPGHGYGAALKAGIEQAQTDLVLTMDGDGQHAACDAKRLEDFFLYFCNRWNPSHGHYQLDMVVGDRRLLEKQWKRYWGRKALNWTASFFAGRFIPDLNSGMRLFRRNVAMGYFPILSDGFSFTTSLTLAFMADGYGVDYLPIRVDERRHGYTKVHLWRDGWMTLRTIFWIGLALRTRRLRAWLRRWA